MQLLLDWKIYERTFIHFNNKGRGRILKTLKIIKDRRAVGECMKLLVSSYGQFIS